MRGSELSNLGETALGYLSAGLSVLATGSDKIPCVGGSWKAYQQRMATFEEARAWFDRADAQVALICGAVSGNLEMIDFDIRAVWFERWKLLVQEDYPGLFEKLVIEQSQSGGKHVCYRYEAAEVAEIQAGGTPVVRGLDGNKKLALQPIEVLPPGQTENGIIYHAGPRSYRAEVTPADGERVIYRVYFDDEKADKGHLVKEFDGKWYAIRCPIETRGEGGYFLCAPSARYELLQGRFEALAVLTAAEREALLQAARSLNKWNPPAAEKPVAPAAAKPAPQALRAAGDISPLDDWAARGDVKGLLISHGYTFVKSDSERDYFTRPGKSDKSISGTLVKRSKVYKNFSSSDPYFDRHGESEPGYSPGSIYATLECRGDLSAAAKKLLSEGFGTKRQAARDQFGAGELERMNRAAELAAQEATNGLRLQEGREKDGSGCGPAVDSSAGQDFQQQSVEDIHGCIDHGQERTAVDRGRKDQIEAGGTAGGATYWPGQPAPLGPPPQGNSERADLANFRWEDRYVVDEKTVKNLSADDEKKLIEFRVLAKRSKKETLVADEELLFKDLISRFGAKLTPVRVALNADEVRATATKALNGWPMLMSDTWLFVDDGREDGGVRMIEDAADFKSFIHDYFRPKFETGQDVDRVNYVSMETLYCSLLSTARNWGIVEKYPHEPAFPDHYYTWKPPADYVADGGRLAEFLGFFDNIQDATSRAVFAGATLTMFSGIPYGQRPLFIHDAAMQGSGKSSGAVEIGRLAGGLLLTKLTRKDEDELFTRLLSPLGMEIRGILWDNIETVFKSALVAQLITADPVISGRRLREGEGRRPANLVCFASLNAARVDSDIARRCFFAYFIKPDKGSEELEKWRTNLSHFVTTHMHEIQADCIHVLSLPKPVVNWGKSKGETFALWAGEVLGRALAHPKILAAVMSHEALESSEDVTVLDVIEQTQLRRNERNKDIEEAGTFMDGLCERVVAWKRLLGNNTGVLPTMLDKDVFIRTSSPPKIAGTNDMGYDIKRKDADDEENMVNYWEAIFDKRLTGNQVVDILNGHILAGRMRGLRKGRHPKTGVRGFDLSYKTINEWCDSKKMMEREHEKVECAQVSDTSDSTDSGL